MSGSRHSAYSSAIVAGATLLQFPARKGRPLRVLVADDNASMRRAILSVLERVPNLEVCAVASNGRDAINAARALKPNVLIIDQVMPGLSGVEVIGVLKKSLPAAKFILFTMYEDSVGKLLARFAGVDVVI